MPDFEVEGHSNRRVHGDTPRAAEKSEQMILDRNFGAVAPDSKATSELGIIKHLALQTSEDN
jgi:hypothetical protein